MRVFVMPPELQGHPDIMAMLQGFYSRSHTSIEDRLLDLSAGITDPDKIRDSLKRYYIEYSHASLGDCGDITVFIEGVSMLDTCALQSTPLYNGQESSTRYIDFGAQARPEYADEFYDRWMELYQRALPLLIERFTQEHPEYTDAGARAAAFDVARGLLPIGAQTQLSFKGSIRTLREHTAKMTNHPYTSVRKTAYAIIEALRVPFPDLFGVEAQARIPTTWDWYMTDDDMDVASRMRDNRNWSQATPDSSLSTLKLLGTRTSLFSLDYGSYRDLQRHRNAYIRILPVLGTEQYHHVPLHHKWYTDQLPDLIRTAAAKLRLEMHASLNAQSLQQMITSLPMMSLVYGAMTLDIPQLQYMTKLRTATTVHATLRQMMAQQAHDAYSAFPNLRDMLTVYEGPNDYAKRGTQTILKDGKAIT